MTHLKTIGVQTVKGGREINIPSVVKGKQVSQRKAMEAFFGKGKEGRLNRALGKKKSPNKKRVTKSFKSRAAATKAAQKLSKSFDRKNRK